MSRGVTPSETLGFTLGVSSGSAPLEAETEAASLGSLGARRLRQVVLSVFGVFVCSLRSLHVQKKIYDILYSC